MQSFLTKGIQARYSSQVCSIVTERKLTATVDPVITEGRDVVVEEVNEDDGLLVG